MDREIAIYCSVPRLEFDESEVRRMLACVDGSGIFPIPGGELSIAFLDDATVAILHGKFLNDGTPTDVITFPGDPVENFAGEICISVEYAAQYATDHRSPFADEMVLYLIHGWLHLAGLDDRTLETAATMRRSEQRLMDFLRHQGIWPNFVFNPSEKFSPPTVHAEGKG
jgi:probable rRNA maturation factor